MMNARTWLEVGQPVAVVHSRGRVDLRMVERFTKTRVVLTDGTWFPLDQLSRRFGGSWGYTARLEDPNSDSVVEAIRNQQVRELCNRIYTATRDMTDRPTREQLAALGQLASSLAAKCGAS